MAKPDSLPKRHHYLPRAYLKAWGDVGGFVAVRRQDASHSFPTNIDNVGVERHLYGEGPQALWRERNFGLLESSWPRIRQQLISRGLLTQDDRSQATVFLALQIARTREHIASSTFIEEFSQAEPARPVTKDAVRRFIRERHGQDPSNDEVDGAWALVSYQIDTERWELSFDQAFAISIDVAVRQLAPILDNLFWRVETCSQPILWASDRPVMPWRPPSEKDSFEGLGYGDCDEIRVPLAPNAMLVMAKRQGKHLAVVRASRFHEYNADIAAQCYEFVVSSVGRRKRLDALSLAPNRPALRFNQAPGVQVGTDGSEIPLGDIIHTWTPLRA